MVKNKIVSWIDDLGEINNMGINFTDLNRTVAITDSEKIQYGWLAEDITWSVLEPYANEPNGKTSILRGVVPDSFVDQCRRTLLSGHSDEYAGDRDDLTPFSRMVRDYFKIQAVDHSVVIENKVVGCREIILNTAHELGSSGVKLAMRWFTQSQYDCYVLGKNRKWVASLIESEIGVKDGKLFTHPKWKQVVDLLRENSRTPVVFNPTDGYWKSFPKVGLSSLFLKSGLFPHRRNQHLLEEQWQQQDKKQQFEDCFNNLVRWNKKEWGGKLELSPDGFDEFQFGSGKTASDLIKSIQERHG